ncbi:MAG: polynucleotide adenylyltransferase PcnB [Pseudohongiellaceae bacterium]
MTETASLPGLEKATAIERNEHAISRRNISPNALKVLRVLGKANFHAFLVGGGVRDLLLNKHPKDFDVATDATPEQIRKLFRNSRIIGRRFKIVHIRFGRETIEVTTFRAHHEVKTRLATNQSRKRIAGLDSAHASSGMILRDNVYGNINEDALRRDFTVNALYYTTDQFRLYDFCGSLNDLQARQLRIIGDPELRYTEDPVRMLRAIRFAAKLGFGIEPATEAPINSLAPLLEAIAPARLFDESLKLLAAGYAEKTYALLRHYEVGKYLFGPTLQATCDPELTASKVVNLALRNTDVRIADGKTVTPAFLFAALLWPVLQQRLQQRLQQHSQQHPQQYSQQHSQQRPGERVNLQQLGEVANEVLAEQSDFTAIPKRFAISSREIWEAQLRLEQRSRQRVYSLLQHQRFRAAYDFLLLRNEAGEELEELCQWWTEFQFSDTKRQEEMVAALQTTGKRRRRRRKRKSAEAGQ